MFAPRGTYREIATRYTVRFVLPEQGGTLCVGGAPMGRGLLALIGAARAGARKLIASGTARLISPEALAGMRHAGFGADQDWSVSECVEVDINSAYLQAAAQLKLVSGPLYAKLKGAAKSTRLIALGSLATIRRITEYVGGAVTERYEESEAALVQAWRSICWRVDEAMLGACLAADSHGQVLFWWCDAGFLSPAAVEPFAEFLRDEGFAVKIKRGLVARRVGFRIVLSDGREFPILPGSRKGEAAQG